MNVHNYRKRQLTGQFDQFGSSSVNIKVSRFTENLLKNVKLICQGRVCVYHWPPSDDIPCKTRTGRNVVNGLCDDYPSSQPIRLLVRLYVVKGECQDKNAASSISGRVNRRERIDLQASTCNLATPSVENLTPICVSSSGKRLSMIGRIIFLTS